jgi:alpha-tubulin suppressor-like RCC1 family protein
MAYNVQTGFLNLIPSFYLSPNQAIGWGTNGSGELGNGSTTNTVYQNTVPTGLSPVRQIVSGLYNNGTTVYPYSVGMGDLYVYTWGSNNTGQLGTGNTTPFYTPHQNASLPHYPQFISAGNGNWFAILVDGSLWGCGYNKTSELGTGNTTNYSTPTQIGTASSWTFVSGGKGSTFAITNGYLYAWGSNTYGQIGNNTVGTVYNTPTNTNTGNSWSSVAMGNGSAAGIKTDGTLWTWGLNSYGQLGQNTVASRSSPVMIGTVSDTWSSVAWGVNTLYGVKTNGTLWACGYNLNGSFGTGGSGAAYYSSPIQIGSLTNWKSVSSCAWATNSAAAGLQNSGAIFAWGYNGAGFANTGTWYSTPVQVGTIRNWSAVSTNTQTTLAFPGSSCFDGYAQDLGSRYVTKSYLLDVYPNIMPGRTTPGLWACGYDNYGQLGNNSTNNYSSPIQIGNLTNWLQVSGGYGHTMAVKTDGTLWGTGYNPYGQLGTNSNINYSSPIQIGALTTWKQIATHNYHTLGIQTNGSLWAWGYNATGGLGTGTNAFLSSPVQVGNLTNWKQVACGDYHSAAINTTGYLYTWGRNAFGQIGNGTTTYYSSPIQIGSLSNWKQVACGDAHTIGVKTDGTLWAWGYNFYGQLGVGSTSNFSSPLQIGSDTNWKSVSCGFDHSVAIRTDGSIWSWGYNSSGQLGNGTATNYSSPIQIGTLTNWKQISAGYQFTLAIKTDGTLWGHGYNLYGELGITTGVVSYSSPVQIGTRNTWKSVSAGWYHMAAISDGYI